MIIFIWETVLRPYYTIDYIIAYSSNMNSKKKLFTFGTRLIVVTTQLSSQIFARFRVDFFVASQVAFIANLYKKF